MLHTARQASVGAINFFYCLSTQYKFYSFSTHSDSFCAHNGHLNDERRHEIETFAMKY